MKNKIDTFNIVEHLMEISPEYDNKELKLIENKYKCTISYDIEKHNYLQYTYFYEIDFEDIVDKYFIEIESGINNGTVLLHEEWNIDSKQITKTIDILKDIILDKNFYEDNYIKRKAQVVLDSNKHKLFKYHRKNNYDNYVTGGNSKLKLDLLLSKLHLEYIYEEKEVDCNFI